MAEPKLCCTSVAFAKLFEQFLGMQSDTSEHVLHNLACVTCLAL